MQIRFRYSKYAWLIPCLVLVFPACKTTYTSPKNVFPRMEIGEGGGFTGAVSSYQILPNGQIFKKSVTDTGFYEIMSIKAGKAKKHIAEAKLTIANKPAIYEPDNIYKSMILFQADTVYYSVWYRNQPLLDSIYNSVLRDIEKANEILR